MYKNILAILFISATSLIHAQQADDCGLSDFLNHLANRIYRSAETSGGDEIPGLLNRANDEFAQILAACSPTKEATEDILHGVAYTGTPEMLETLAQTPNFNGCDNVGKNNTTPIATAAFCGNIDLVKALLARGADPYRTFLMPNGTVKTLNDFAQLVPAALCSGHGRAVFITLLSTMARYQELEELGAYSECLKLIEEAQQHKE